MLMLVVSAAGLALIVALALWRRGGRRNRRGGERRCAVRRTLADRRTEAREPDLDRRSARRRFLPGRRFWSRREGRPGEDIGATPAA